MDSLLLLLNFRKMELLQILGLSVLGVIMLIGLLRVIFSPYTNFINLLIEIMLIDYLIDGLGWVFESIGSILDD